MLGNKPHKPGHHIAAAYLARMAEGLEPLKRFVQSYLRHSAGVEHDLVVIYKGYSRSGSFEDARAVFASIPHRAIEVSDEGFDIGAYLAVAPQLEHDYICFMNTFTEIEADGWLLNLYRHASSPGTGVVGAMGSYESLSTSSRLIHKVLWLCNEAAVPFDEKIAYYYDFVIEDHCKFWKAGGQAGSFSLRKMMLALAPRQIYRRCRSIAAAQMKLILDKGARGTLEERFQRRWESRIGPGGDMATTACFPVFPNPHIRSNGFMVPRQRMLEFPPGSIRTKMDACAFESGADSLTNRVRREGLAALIVGRDGIGYDMKEWCSSKTFRCVYESNILLSDNQSRMFRRMTPGARATHLRITWGDYLGNAPDDFPGLGFHFPVNCEITGAPRRGRNEAALRQ